MKKFNLVYLLFFLVIGVIWQLNTRYGKHTVMFYGFAETKETEINLDHPVEVNRLFVTPGQKVKKGELLAEVTHSTFGLKLNNISHSMDELRLEENIFKADIRSSISRLEAQKVAKESELNSQIRQLETEIEVNRSLLEGLKSIDISEATVNPRETKIASLREELELVVKPLEIQIARLNEELTSPNSPKRIQIRKLKEDQKFYTEEKDGLSIFAPKDGLIGNIYCKEKENISSFNTLISFYEENPTMVKGYVHENLILEVAVGDTIEAISTQHPEHKCQGVITGLGSRIVQIPERLSKNPDLKTYGREVLISIPPSNFFLQKEKVMLNLLKETSRPATIFDLILDSSEEKTNKVITGKG
jgi:multidrug resistance efflux pump